MGLTTAPAHYGTCVQAKPWERTYRVRAEVSCFAITSADLRVARRTHNVEAFLPALNNMSLPRTLVGFSSTDIDRYRLMQAWKASERELE